MIQNDHKWSLTSVIWSDIVAQLTPNVTPYMVPISCIEWYSGSIHTKKLVKIGKWTKAGSNIDQMVSKWPLMFISNDFSIGFSQKLTNIEKNLPKVRSDQLWARMIPIIMVPNNHIKWHCDPYWPIIVTIKHSKEC